MRTIKTGEQSIKPDQGEGGSQDSAETYRKLFNSVDHSVFVHPFMKEGFGHFIDVNDVACLRYGYSRDEFMSLTALDITTNEFSELHGSSDHRERLRVEGTLVFEAEHVTKAGEAFPVEIHSNILDLGGEQVLLSVVHDLSQRRESEEALESIQAGVAGRAGKEFFDSMVLNLARSLRADFSFVGELIGDARDRVRTISFCAEGEIGDSFEYDLAGSPCQGVIRGEICTVPDGVDAQFPENQALVNLGVRAYVGMPLFDANERLVGIMVALFREPLSNPGSAESILKIFASRAGAELERSAQHTRVTLLEKAVESSGEVVFMTDPDGIFTYLNPEFTRLYGYSRDEVLGKETPRILKSGLLSKKEYKNFWDTILAKGTATGEFVNKTKDGRFLTVAVSANPILGEDGEVTGFLAIQRDISGGKDAERALQESEERLRSVFRVAPIGIGIVRDRNLIDVNEEVCRMVGRPREELEGNSSRLLYASHEDFEEVGREKYAQIEEFGTGTVETRWLHADGRTLDIILTSTPIDRADLSKGVIFTAADITRRKKSEEALRRSEQRFRNVIEQSSDAIYILFEGRFDLVNQRFCEMTGVTPEEVRRPGFQFWELVAPESVPVVEDRQRRREEGQEVPGLYDFSIQRKDGTRIHVEASVKEIDYRGGRAVLGLLRDVTEQEKTEERLRGSQRMEALGRLSGGVAHDLNNLLTPILGYGDLLLDDLGPDDRRREAAEEIVRAGVRARDLVRQLLAFGRRQTLEFSGVDLNHLVSGFESLLRRTVREDIEIELRLAQDIPGIRADVVQIEQVIMNLTVNAANAMGDGGRITIETAVTELDELFSSTHPGAKPGLYVTLAVTDTGHGMTADTRERVFEPFFTTREEGTGLGLATVYGVVKQHGGSIWVESEPEKGTTFRCHFPVRESAEALPQEPEEERQKASEGLETIMVVEDEAAVRNLAVTLLARHGYVVLSAENGEECLSLLEKYDGPLELVLTDVIMPGLKGPALFKEILARFPRARVLYMSGYTDDLVSHHGVLEEGIAFIQKPFSVHQLTARVREVLDGPEGS